MPNSAKQGYWQCLSREAKARLMHVARVNDFKHVGRKKMVDHSVFYVDFGDGSDSYAPPCAQAWRRRPGLPRLRQNEEADGVGAAASTAGGARARGLKHVSSKYGGMAVAL